MLAKEFHLLTEISRRPVVVRVEECDELASRRADAGIASTAWTGVRLLDVVDPSSGIREPALQRVAVRRAVVDHDYFVVAERLCFDRTDRIPDEIGGLVSRYHNAHQRPDAGSRISAHSRSRITAHWRFRITSH